MEKNDPAEPESTPPVNDIPEASDVDDQPLGVQAETEERDEDDQPLPGMPEKEPPASG